MNALMNPVGPKDPSVYWRRRVAVLVLLVALLVVVFVVVRLTTGGGDDAAATAGTTQQADGGSQPAVTAPAGNGGAPEGGATAAPTGAATTEPATEASPTESPVEPSACGADAVQLTATADAASYQAGAQPRLGVLIRNVGKAACSLDAGSAAIELTVVSGSDRVWSSDDCQQDPSSEQQTLPAGAELASSVLWPVQRSAEGCPADLPAPKPGTYQLTGRVGDITSEPLAFTLG